MFEIIGSKQSENGKTIVVIEKDVNDRRQTIYTVYNNDKGTKKVFTR